MLRWISAIVLAASCAAIAVGCAENAKASAKCKDVRDGDECSKCCSSNGASGNTYTSGGGCTCRGG